jgi:hypothetical protein
MRYRSLVRATEPANNPVTLAEAKLHLRIDSADDDALIGNLITAATKLGRGLLRPHLLQHPVADACRFVLRGIGSPVQFGLKADGNNIEGRQGTVPSLDIELPRPPMVLARTATAVTITYTPSAGASTTTLDATEYRVDRQATPGVCRPLYGKRGPPTSWIRTAPP